jgi:hypothetical protein
VIEFRSIPQFEADKLSNDRRQQQQQHREAEERGHDTPE